MAKRYNGAPFLFTGCNIAKENRRRGTVIAALTKVLRSSDIVVFQEVETVLLRACLRIVAASLGFRVFWPGSYAATPRGGRRLGSSANATPIAYRASRFAWTGRWTTVFLTDGQRGNFPNRWGPFLMLRDKHSRRDGVAPLLEVFTGHQVPGAWSGRLPQNRGEWTEIDHKLASMAARRNDADDPPLVGEMDANRDLATIAGLRAWNPPHATHGTSRYDTLYGSHIEMDQLAALTVGGSDHRAPRGRVLPRYLVPLRKKATVA